MPHILNLKLSFKGDEADSHQLDFYDVAQALIGFERSLALTTHLVLNRQIITQAPSLKGARIFAVPPQEGSWEIIAAIVTAGAAGLYKLSTIPRDTPLGHIISSVYDYVIQRTLGFPVDYDKSLGQQMRDLRALEDSNEEVTKQQLDSLIEKTETAIKQIHRPIIETKTATRAEIFAVTAHGMRRLGPPLTEETFERMQLIEKSRESDLEGRVSSYNINTFRGRIYVDDEQRPIPFELTDVSRDPKSVATVAASLSRNATSRDRASDISFRALRITTKTGRLKTLLITHIDSD